jgi:hypothetical protein
MASVAESEAKFKEFLEKQKEALRRTWESLE